MTHKTLGRWEMASGNVVVVVVTIGAGDVPAVLSLRCEWLRYPPSREDIAEYKRRVQPAIGGLLAPLVGGRVVVI